MEAQVVFNALTSLFDLIIEINGSKQTLSSSKSYGHWQYHFNRGTLSKSVAKYGVNSFVYVGFTPDAPPPTKALQPYPAAPEVEETSWFATKSISECSNKKRGRPRKHVPNVTGVIIHNMDNEQPRKEITSVERETIERNFKMFIKSMDSQEALSELMFKFQLPYKLAYDIVESYI
jgi:hypothetical protein